MRSALEVLIDAAGIGLVDWQLSYPAHRPAGYLCSYVPEEMLHAAGLAPVRVRACTHPLRRVDAHLQSFSCALCRSTLDQLLCGDLGSLAGVVFAHTCDAMQALADLWRMNAPAGFFVLDVMQPVNLGSPSAGSYLIAELNRFRDRLASVVGHPIDDSDLCASIALYDETRRQVQLLGMLRDRLSAQHFYAVVDAAQSMPRELFLPLLSELLADLDTAPMLAKGPRLFLAGPVLDEPRLLGLIEALGAQVVGDDLCTSSRHFHGQVGIEPHPIAALAAYYLGRPPCPTKFHPEHDPASHLLDQARRARADGLLFVLEKYCEPHAFDYARVRGVLDQSAMPHLVLEMEHSPNLEGLRTRIQAFVEIL